MASRERRDPVVFENAGQKVFAVIHRPISVESAPAILICHGFAGNKVGKFRIYVALAQYLAERGIASLRLDFRGSGDSEGQFSEMTVDSEVSDAIQGLRFLSTFPGIDPKRIGILGNSFGGAVAVLAASQVPEVRSIALLAALFSGRPWHAKWEALMGNGPTESAQQELSRILEGEAPGSEFFRSLFRMDLAPALKKLNQIPMLHISSERDEKIGMDHLEGYQRARKETSVLTRWLRLHHSDHVFSDSVERFMVIEEVGEWFIATLR